MAERDRRTSLLTAIGDGLLLLCALAGLTGSFLTLYGDGALGKNAPYRATALDLCAARWGDLLLLAVVFALLALAAWSLPRYRGAAAGALAALTAIAAALNWERVIHGAGLTIHIISEQFSRRVTWGQTFQYDPGLTSLKENAAVRLFLILALALLALALGWAVVRARRWWLAALLTLPPLLPGLLADLYPFWPAFLALCACWCAMLLCDLCKWAAPDRRGKFTLVALACVAVLLSAVSLIFPREGYTRPQWALDLEVELNSAADRISDYFSRFDGPFRSTVTYVGSAGEADLANAGPLNYTGRTVLRVTSDYSGRLYLRGSSLAVYEGGVWKPLPEGDYQTYLDDLADTLGDDADNAPSPLLFPALQGMPGRESFTATVENVGAAGSCAYMPYYPKQQGWKALGLLPVEDSYFARLQGQNSFTVAFRQRHPAHGASQFEPIYREWVQERYLDVPEELRGALEDTFLQYGMFCEDPVGAAEDVAQLLDGLCRYDPQVPAAPEGTDPVEHFLTESHRGYCMHYASAAALMLRALGFPARYVSGFTADCAPDAQVSVPDHAAHAWVEVYVEGFGWYPVEVTPAAAFEWYAQGEAQPSSAPSAPAAESEAPAPTPTLGPTAAPAATEGPTAAPSAGADGPAAGGPGWAPLLAALKALAVVLGAAALLWLGQWLPKRHRAKRLSSPDHDRAALDGYGYLLRLERWGGRVDERAVELAQKAKFSQHSLTREEVDEIRAMVDRERDRLCIVLAPVQRLVFRYLWGKAPPRT